MASEWVPVVASAITAGAAVVGGLIVAVVTTRQSRETRQAEAQMRREERAHERRAELYVALLESVLRGVETMTKMATTDAEPGEIQPSSSREADRLLVPRVAAYASPAVRDLAREWWALELQASSQLSIVRRLRAADAVRTLTQDEDDRRRVASAGLLSVNVQARLVYDRLAEQVNAELSA